MWWIVTADQLLLHCATTLGTVVISQRALKSTRSFKLVEVLILVFFPLFYNSPTHTQNWLWRNSGMSRIIRVWEQFSREKLLKLESFRSMYSRGHCVTSVIRCVLGPAFNSARATVTLARPAVPAHDWSLQPTICSAVVTTLGESIQKETEGGWKTMKSHWTFDKAFTPCYTDRQAVLSR